MLLGVQTGDQVLAYDLEAGMAVSREVKATLPHTDWLLEAHLSDGSVMTVTEDHRFWSVTDKGWVELQDLDTADMLLTPDGVTVTVDWLDWDAGVDAPAWDLTVAEEHNFFVAADHSAVAVLVHNANIVGLGCPDRISPAAAKRLQALSETDGLVSDATAEALLSIESRVVRESISEAIGRAEDLDAAALIAENAARSRSTTLTVAANLPDVADVVLGGARYSALVGRNADVTREIVRAIRRADLSVDEQRELARIVFDTDRGDVALDYLSGIGSGRWNDFARGFRNSVRRDVSTSSEVEAWYMGSVLSGKREGWDFASRVSLDAKWTVPPGKWESRIPGAGLDEGLVTGSRTSLKDDVADIAIDDRFERNIADNFPDADTVQDLTPNQIGDFGERTIRDELVDEEFAAGATTVEVKLTNGTTFRFVPDFLVVTGDPVPFVDADGVEQILLNLRYIESKASRNVRPGIGTLSENQAVFLAALRNGELESLTAVGSDLLRLVGDQGATRIDIVDFELVSFLVSQLTEEVIENGLC